MHKTIKTVLTVFLLFKYFAFLSFFGAEFPKLVYSIIPHFLKKKSPYCN